MESTPSRVRVVRWVTGSSGSAGGISDVDSGFASSSGVALVEFPAGVDDSVVS